MNLVCLIWFLAVADPVVQPAQPNVFVDENTLCDWVSNVVHDTPPVGGEVHVIVHEKPEYLSARGVWVVTALVKISVGDGDAYHIIIAGYEIATGKTGLAYDEIVPEDEVKKMLGREI